MANAGVAFLVGLLSGDVKGHQSSKDWEHQNAMGKADAYNTTLDNGANAVEFDRIGNARSSAAYPLARI